MAMAPAPMMPPDPTAGAGMGADPGAAPPPAADDDSGDVVVTISKSGDGSYLVYAGDEPDAGGDMSGDDAEAMGSAGGAPAGGGMAGGMGGGGAAGQPADSIGAALKLALDIMQSAASSAGAPGSGDDQLAAGFSADKSPTPAMGGKVRQKY